MNTQDRKIYNQKYYTDNKDDIVKRMLIKKECPTCSKLYSSVNLARHQKSYCKKTRISQAEKDTTKIVTLCAEITMLKAGLIIKNAPTPFPVLDSIIETMIKYVEHMDSSDREQIEVLDGFNILYRTKEKQHTHQEPLFN